MEDQIKEEYQKTESGLFVPKQEAPPAQPNRQERRNITKQVKRYTRNQQRENARRKLREEKKNLAKTT